MKPYFNLADKSLWLSLTFPKMLKWQLIRFWVTRLSGLISTPLKDGGSNPRARGGLIRLSVVMTEVLTVGPKMVRVFVNEKFAWEITDVRSGKLEIKSRDGTIGDYLSIVSGVEINRNSSGSSTARPIG
jgi:hypothetical protein